MLIKKKVDSAPDFPRSEVHSGTEAVLISVFEMGTDEPRPYGRLIRSIMPFLYKYFAREMLISS